MSNKQETNENKEAVVFNNHSFVEFRIGEKVNRQVRSDEQALFFEQKINQRTETKSKLKAKKFKN